MSTARFSADAEADLLAIVEFIARDNPVAAREWLRSIRERCDRLAQHPLTGESRPGFGVAGCRSVSVGVYVTFFRPTPDSVETSPLPDWQRAELERRLADSVANPDAVRPWGDVEAAALARAKR